MNKWLKLMIPDGDGGGAPAATPEPASTPSAEPAASPTPAESISDTAPAPAERISPITADVAERLGVSTAKPIDVKPLAALGLEKAPRDSINELLQKDAAKITRNVPFERKAVSGGPAAKPAASMQNPPAAQAEPQATVVPPVPAVTPPVTAPVAVQKYKVGDKEYTPEQMAAYLDALNSRPQAQPQVQPPAQPVQQQPQPVNRQAPEQRLTAEQTRARESVFVAEASKHIDLGVAGLQVTPEQADQIAAGGETGSNLLNNMMQRSVAYGALLSRKTMAHDLNPIIQAHADALRAETEARNEALRPIREREAQLAVYETENSFAASYPDLLPHIDTARVVAHELVRQYPDWAKTVTREDFCKVVAEQTPAVLQRFGVTITPRTTAPAVNVAPTAPQAPRTATPANPAIPRVATSRGPKPPASAAPGKPAAAPIPTQSREGFQKVAVSSMAALR